VHDSDHGAAAERLGALGLSAADVDATLEALAAPSAPSQLQRAIEFLSGEIGQIDSVSPLPALDADPLSAGRLWTIAFAATAPAVRAWHAAHGIGDDVSWATLRDLARHVAQFRRRQGATGLGSAWWLALHWRGALFELGRLQFNTFNLRTGPAGPLFWYDDAALAALGPDLQVGAAVLGVHIPTGAPLDPDACERSFATAAQFFPRHFAERASPIVTCTSWLLDEQLTNYLPESSNIVRFQRRFTMLPGALTPYTEIFNWVFDRIPASFAAASLDALSPRTQLERAVVDHVRQGGEWRLRTGWLRLSPTWRTASVDQLRP
jgi:hypothetical protein